MGAQVLGGHGDAGQHRAGRVGDAADDVGGRDLGEGRCLQQEEDDGGGGGDAADRNHGALLGAQASAGGKTDCAHM